MKKFTKLFVGVFCALLLATSAFAADTAVKATNAPVAVETVKAPAPADVWTLSLGGAGVTTTTSDSKTAFGFDVGIGRTGHWILPLEAGVRQSWAHVDGDNVFSTRVYNDWTVWKPVKKVDVFAGGNVGLTYGNTPTVWTAAPEAGVRWWLRKYAAIETRVEYPFNLNDGRGADALSYFVALKVRLK